MRSRCLSLVVPIACLLSIAAAHAEVATLVAVKDNTLFENPEGALSNGAGQHLFAGRTGEGTVVRGLVAFDVAAQIPSGATITRAELTLYLSRFRSGPLDVHLHRVEADWGEGVSQAAMGEGVGAPSEPGDATWLHTFYDGEFWSVPGGDFASAPSATQSVFDTGFYTWGPTPELVFDVQMWLDAPAANHGWIVIGDEVDPGSAKRFDSHENEEPAFRPVLSVEYEVACDPQPAGQGYWHRQCLGVPEDEGGLDPRGGGHGPSDPTEPDFVEAWMPCAAARLAGLGFDDVTTCDGMDADPPRSCREKALKKLTALILNVCSGRLQASCTIDSAPAGCEATTVGELVEEVAGDIHEGRCRQAARCANATAAAGGASPFLRDRRLSPARHRPRGQGSGPTSR